VGHLHGAQTARGQPLRSDLAIETTLVLSIVCGLRLRPSGGLLSFVFDMLGLDLRVHDHATLSSRSKHGWQPLDSGNDRQHPPDGSIHVLVDGTGLKVYGAGQWLEETHGAKFRRSWGRLHLTDDADNGEMIGCWRCLATVALLDQIDD